MDSGFVNVGGGRAHYVRAGGGPPLLLIHGIVGSSANWRRNIPALIEHRTVYALDLLGMGRSDRVAGLAAGLEATARRVLATMDALGIAEADIGAASHGGAVAMMIAELAPERVRSMVLFAPANPYNSRADWMVRFYRGKTGGAVARVSPWLPRRVHNWALARMFGDASRIPEGSLDAYLETLRVSGTIPHVLSIVRSWFVDMEKLRAALPQVANTPTLLVWGDRDRVVSVHSGRRLQRELAAELVVFKHGGHLVFEEFAEDVNRLMADWLKRGR